MTTPTGPLTQQHLDQIKNALDIIALAKQQAEMATRAGVDIGTSLQQLNDTQAKLLQIKNVYFPGQ